MVGNFISKSLPVLIHLQICEAFENIVGTEFRKQLIDFERFKVNELYPYVQTASIDCVRIMDERCQSFLKFFHKNDKGVIPCTFGEDIKPDLEGDETTYINNSYHVKLQDRFARTSLDHSKMNECYNAVIQKENRNKILIQYKLKQLNPDFLLPLQKRVLQHKV